MKTTIITGGSKGLGKSLTEIYCKNNFQVISIARSQSDFQHPNCRQIQADLSETSQLEKLMTEVFTQINVDKITQIELINNAAMLGEVTPLENCSPASIEKTMALNLTAPMILSSLFLNKLKGHSASQRVVNISSGAALKAYFGWSVYCTSKAGLDMLTRSIAVEQTDKNIKAISIYPGIIDTDMQSQIRNTKKEDFIHVERFINYKKEGQLAAPSTVAEQIYKLIQKNTFENGDLLNI